MVFKKAVSNKRREASLCRWRPSNRLLHGDILEKIIELEINDWAGTPSLGFFSGSLVLRSERSCTL
jgi:hypothetical protein